MKHLNMSVGDIEKLLLKESGWFGMSGCKDARELENSFQNKKNDAEATVNSIVYRIKGYLGSYYWNLNGKVDAVVFTGGVGENWSLLRELCFDDANKLGFDMDKIKNSKTYLVDGPVDVSSSQSEKRILVIPTNEEYSIANKTLEVLHSEDDNN